MNKPGASQKVYDYVHDGIRTGIWKSGDKIPSENALALKLEVSRVSVRKALDQLVGIGLLIKKQGSGAFISQIATIDTFDALIPVLQMSDIEVIKLLEYRIGFETTNVELLQHHISKKIIEQMEYCLAMMQKHKDDLENFYKYDYQFHHTIAEGTQNLFVIKISEMLTEMLKKHLESLNKIIGPEIGLEYHAKIISAIKDNDFVIAARYMKRHMQVTIDAVQNAQKASQNIENPIHNDNA